MLLRRVIRFNTTLSTFKEHYIYKGNAPYNDFREHILQKHETVPQDTQVFKPETPIEFDRRGELTLYNCNVFTHVKPMTRYPYCLWHFSAPWMLYLYFMNPFQLTWQYNNAFIVAPLLAGYLHFEYIWGLQFHINRLSLLRGGTILRVETSNLNNTRYIAWVPISELNVLSADLKMLEPQRGLNSEPVNEKESKLNYETHVQAANFTFIGRNVQDQVLVLLREGQVNRPDILQAVLRGFDIDTSDFKINTRNNERWLEPSENNQFIPDGALSKKFHAH